MLSVDNFRIVFAHLSCIRNFIAQFVEGIHDDFKGFTLVMALQVFNVFKNKDGRFFCADNTRHIDFTNIEIESVFLSIVKPVSFICAHSLFIPFTGKNALATDGFEALPYTSNPSKQVNKPEGIVRVMCRRFRKHFS
ncbi:Uncharacterised protein [Klebsiella pneumoniae]|nr:Uncharacterised protein [Klebsiella pneumoniae]